MFLNLMKGDLMNPEEVKPEVTADWARQQAEKKMLETTQGELNRILSAIAKASRLNHKSLWFKKVHPFVQKELERRGFKVLLHLEHYQFYTINW